MKTLSAIIAAAVCFAGCTGNRWTEQRKKDFEKKCSETDTVNGLYFSLTGFDYDEIETITVRQIHRGQMVDSFYVHPNKDPADPIRKRYSANIDRPLYIKDAFQFIIKDQEPFILSDMKMIMWDQFSMMSEGYGCVIGDYKINGTRFEQNPGPDFRKKGFKFSWE